MSESTVPQTPFEQIEYERLPLHVYFLGAALVLIGLITFILMSTGEKNSSYLYLFFYAIPSNAAISVFPHEPVLIYYGTFANIWLASLAALGGTIVAGYLDHRVFVPVVNYRKITSYKESSFYQKMTGLFMRLPFVTLVITASLPIPFFPFKFLSFSINYPLWRYLAALSVARFPRYLLLAWLGAAFGVPKELLIGAVVIVFTLYIVRGGPALYRRLRARRAARRAAAPAPVSVPTEGSE